MKAVIRDRYGSADVLRLEDMAKPMPGDGQVLVRIRATSINTADIDHLKGRPMVARLGTGLLGPKTRVPGLDMAGVVEAVGRNATRLVPGDEVWADLFSYGFGTFAEYVCAAEGAFHPKPPGVTFEQAATVPHSAVLALQALRSRRPIQPGDEVLVNGGGGCVGPFAIQIAKSYGAEVTGVDHGAKLDLMRSVGADRVIDYTREDLTKSARQYDLIVDIAANRWVLAFKRSLRPGGSYVQIAHGLLGFFGAAVLGGLFGGDRKMGVFMWTPNRGEDLQTLGHLVETGEVTPVIHRVYTLGELPEALRSLERGEARGKLVVIT